MKLCFKQKTQLQTNTNLIQSDNEMDALLDNFFDNNQNNNNDLGN